MMVQNIRVLALLLLLGPVAAHAAWPEIGFPQGAQVEAIGDQVRLNGIPMRMHRVVSKQNSHDVIDFYRSVLGDRRAERRISDSLILSQERGDYFITVKVRALSATVTEVLVSASDMVEAKRAANRPLGFGLPADSAVLSDMESVDAGKRSRQLVINNSHTVDSNVAALTQELAARGLQPDGAPGRHTNSEHVQMFKGAQQEARLTVVRRADTSHIVLTTILNP
ncbi:MAG: hypothetical protein V4858_18750 [Pseudomonadota bacterium]